MFREMVRKNQALPREECIALLQTQTRGVLSVLGDGGYPYGMPMNHYYNPADGCLYFHCGRQKSHRTDALTACDKASFCVYDQGFRREGEWALNVKSVVVFGRVELVDDPDLLVNITTRLSHKFTRDEAYIQHEIAHHAHRTLLLKLIPQQITGKLVNEA